MIYTFDADDLFDSGALVRPAERFRWTSARVESLRQYEIWCAWRQTAARRKRVRVIGWGEWGRQL